MERRVSHLTALVTSALLLLLLLLLLRADPVSCHPDRSSWSIELDINRLLSHDDPSLYRREEFQQSPLNGTSFANSTSGENATSFWHLPADAPLVEQPIVDVSHNPTLSKHIRYTQRKPVTPSSSSSTFSLSSPSSCNRLHVLPLHPIYEFLAYMCGGLLFGSLSSAWMILLCSRRLEGRTQPQRGSLTIKCSLILGLNVHATVCALAFLLLQAASRGTFYFVALSPRQMSNFCNFAISVLDICTAVFWLFVGFSNTLLIVLLGALKPEVNRTEAWKSIFKSQRNSVFFSLLAHIVPWICGIALNTLQLIFLQETPAEVKLQHGRGQLLTALNSVLPVLFAVITIGTRLWKFQGHKLHLPSMSRVAPSYACQHDYSPVRNSLAVSTPSTSGNSSPHGPGATSVALFSSTIVTGLHLTCSLLAALAVCLWILSVALSETPVLSRVHAIVMYLSVCLFYAVCLAGYSRRLTLAPTITTRNSYIPGEMVRVSEGRICGSQAEDKLSPRELLEIPKFTRTQFFDTLFESVERGEADQCVASQPVQIITVYEPIVS